MVGKKLEREQICRRETDGDQLPNLHFSAELPSLPPGYAFCCSHIVRRVSLPSWILLISVSFHAKPPSTLCCSSPALRRRICSTQCQIICSCCSATEWTTNTEWKSEHATVRSIRRGSSKKIRRKKLCGKPFLPADINYKTFCCFCSLWQFSIWLSANLDIWSFWLILKN